MEAFGSLIDAVAVVFHVEIVIWFCVTSGRYVLLSFAALYLGVGQWYHIFTAVAGTLALVANLLFAWIAFARLLVGALG